MQRKPKAKRRRSRTRIVDDLTANAIRDVAESWSRAESDGALMDGSDLDPERGPEDERSCRSGSRWKICREGFPDCGIA